MNSTSHAQETNSLSLTPVQEDQPSLLFSSEPASVMETFKPSLLFDTPIRPASPSTPTRRGGGGAGSSARLPKADGHALNATSVVTATVATATASLSTSSPTATTSTTLTAQEIRQHADRQWRRASAALQTNPKLMTIDLLRLTLQHRPPTHVIQFMLQLLFQQRQEERREPPALENSGALSSSPLQHRLLELVQVAIAYEASEAVIKLLLQVNPFLLMEHGEDLRQLAQRHGRMELHSLLQQPPSFFWKRTSDATTTTTTMTTNAREEPHEQNLSTALLPLSSMANEPLRFHRKNPPVLLTIPEHMPLVEGHGSSNDEEEGESHEGNVGKPSPFRALLGLSKLSRNRPNNVNVATAKENPGAKGTSQGNDDDHHRRRGIPSETTLLSNITNTSPTLTTNTTLPSTTHDRQQDHQPAALPFMDRTVNNNRVTSSSHRNQNSLTMVNREELDNVKLLCLAALKGQKRLSLEWSKKMAELQQRPFLSSSSSPSEEHERDMEMWLAKCQEMQDRQFKTQLIALDMKERAMRAQVRQMERSVLEELQRARAEYQDLLQQQQHRATATANSMEERTASLTRRLDEWQARTEQQLHKLEMRMNHEAQVNSRFRSYQYSQLDKLQRHQHETLDTADFRDDDATKKTTLDDDDDEDEDDDDHDDHPSWILEPWLDGADGIRPQLEATKNRRKKIMPFIFATPNHRDEEDASSSSVSGTMDCLLQATEAPETNQQQQRPLTISKPKLTRQNVRHRKLTSSASPWWPYPGTRVPPVVMNQPKYHHYKDHKPHQPLGQQQEPRPRGCWSKD